MTTETSRSAKLTNIFEKINFADYYCGETGNDGSASHIDVCVALKLRKKRS